MSFIVRYQLEQQIYTKSDKNVPTLGQPWGWLVYMARLESQLHWLQVCHCPAESLCHFAVQIEWEHICNWFLFLYMDGKGKGHLYHQKACHTGQGYIKYNVGQLEQSRWHNLWLIPPAIHASNCLSHPSCNSLCRVEHIYLAEKGFKAAKVEQGNLEMDWCIGAPFKWALTVPEAQFQHLKNTKLAFATTTSNSDCSPQKVVQSDRIIS